MSSEIHIHHTSFGKPVESADTLIIEFSEERIDFCEFNYQGNKPLFTTHTILEKTSDVLVQEQLINAIKHFGFLKKTYRFVYVNYFTRFFTLCPDAFYEAEQARVLLEFNTGKTDEQIILTDDVTSGIKLIFGINDALKSTLDQVFPQHQMKHSLTVLSQLAMHLDESKKDQLLLHIKSNYIEIIVKQNSKLVLANQFSVKTQEDVLYYVLFILEQYQLNPLNITLKVAGNMDSNSNVITTLKKYIKHVSLSIGHKNINWQSVAGMPQHFNYTLLNRPFCE